eukprot:6130494-Prymnesium_polylepis.1
MPCCWAATSLTVPCCSTYARLPDGACAAGAAVGQRRGAARGERAPARPDRSERRRHGEGQDERCGRDRAHPDCRVARQ